MDETTTPWFHPAGFNYSPPSGWKLHLQGAIPALLTPGSNAPDGDELYLLLVGPAHGITHLGDPRLRQLVEMLLNAPAGLFQGAIQFQPTGADFTYRGWGRQAGGPELLGQLWFAQPGHLLVAVLAVGLAGRIQGRAPEVAASMKAIRFTRPAFDPQLMGRWRGTLATRSLDARDAVGRLQASSVSDNYTIYTLNPDGTYLEEQHSRTIAIGHGVSLDSGDQVQRAAGLWAAHQGSVALAQPDGLFQLGHYSARDYGIALDFPQATLHLIR